MADVIRRKRETSSRRGEQMLGISLIGKQYQSEIKVSGSNEMGNVMIRSIEKRCCELMLLAGCAQEL